MSLKVILSASNAAGGTLVSTDIGTYLLAVTEGLFNCVRDADNRQLPFHKTETGLLDGFDLVSVNDRVSFEGLIEGPAADELNSMLMDTGFSRKLEGQIQKAITRNWKEFSKRLSPRASSQLESQHPDLDVSVKYFNAELTVTIGRQG
jgi:hypothetical protein